MKVDVKLVTSKGRLLKLASKPTFLSSKIFSKNPVAVHKIKETLTLNSAAYVGMCFLNLSKTLMYIHTYTHSLLVFPRGLFNTKQQRPL